MRCPRCDIEYASDAAFCGQCGSPLSTQATPSPPTASAAPTPVTAETRISVASAAIGIFPIALVAVQLFSPTYYRDLGHNPLALVYPLIATGLGVATSLGLSSRLRLVGRLPAALGIMLFVMGLILTSVFHISSELISSGLIYVGYGVVGLGVGLLFPLAFWRFSKKTSSRLKVAMPMAIAAIAGIGAQFVVNFYIGSMGPIVLAALFALVICLPAVLISPIVAEHGWHDKLAATDVVRRTRGR
jgi:hypothetical protein